MARHFAFTGIILALIFLLSFMTVAQESPYEIISAENLSQLEQVASLGTGYNTDLYYTDANHLTVLSDSGVWHYALADDTAPGWEASIPWPIASSPNRRWVLGYTGGLWDRQTESQISELRTSSLAQWAFSEDSLFLALGESDVKMLTGESPCREGQCLDLITLVDLEQQAVILRIEIAEVWNIAFAGDAEYLAVTTNEGTLFYETATGILRFSIPAFISTFSSDGWTGVSWSGNPGNNELRNNLTVWNLQNRSIAFQLDLLPNETLTALKLNADGSRLYLSTVMVNDASNEDYFRNRKTIAVWDLGTGTRIASFEQDTDVLYQLVISPDGRYLVTFSQGSIFFNHPMYIYDLWTLQSRLIPTNERYDVVDFEFSPDSSELTLLYVHGRIEILKFDGSPNRVISEGFPGYVVDLAFEGDEIITTSHTGEVFSWDSENFSLQSRQADCRLYALHSSGLQFCMQREEWTWRESYLLSNGIVPDMETGFDETIIKAVFSPDGKLLAATTTQGGVVLWDTETGNILHRWQDAAMFSFSLSFTSDSRYLIAGASAKIWDVQSYEQVAQVTLAPLWHSQFAVSENEDWLAFPSTDSKIYFWRLSRLVTGEDASADNAFASFEFAEVNYSEVGDVSPPMLVYMDASPDGKLLALNIDSGILLYDVMRQEPVQTIPDWGYLIEFSSDGRFLVVGNGECYCGGADESYQLGYARVWAVPNENDEE